MADVGWIGERAALKALKRAGYRIVAKNWRSPAGEIDVVALDGETLVLVEVKATTAIGGPSAARRVDHKKRERLRGVWRLLAARRDFARRPHRFDVVAVRVSGLRAECTLLKGEFGGG